MRSLLAVAAAACLLAAALAAEAPAALVDRQLDSLTHGRLRVADAAGRSGTAPAHWSSCRITRASPCSGISMRCRFCAHDLSGTLGRDLVESSTESSPATFDLSADDFAVKRLVIAFPAEALLRATDAPSLITAAGGTVEVRADAFAMRRGAFDGGFIARWQGASLPGPRPELRVALGDVRLDGVGNGGEIKGALSNVGGDIEITGTVNLAATGATRVEARLKPRAGIDAERFERDHHCIVAVGGEGRIRRLSRRMAGARAMSRRTKQRARFAGGKAGSHAGGTGDRRVAAKAATTTPAAPAATTTRTASEPLTRIRAIDAMRGTAICLMIVATTRRSI